MAVTSFENRARYGRAGAAPGTLGALALGSIIFGALAGCSHSPRAQLAPAPTAPAADRSAEARQAASDHFYRGKSLALAGDADCARLELQASLGTFRDGSRPGNPDDLAFGEQLWESVRLYESIASGLTVKEERPPADDADSLIAVAPSSTKEELEAAKREVSEGGSPSSFDIPVVVNDQVLRAVAFYQFRTPYAFAAALQRSGRYLPMMRALLKEQGLPQDLVYVAMIESAFKGNAHSRAAAHGFWQFIEGTAKRYGLKKTRYVDERSDPVKSTLAAAAYLRDLYEMFGDWHLSMAGYDTGEGRVLRALQRTGAKDYWELSATGTLHRETRDYVPFVMAAALIARDPARFGFDVVPDPPLAFDVVQVPKALDLGRVATAVGSDLETLQLLNPELRTRTTPPGVAAYPLRLPAGSGPTLLAQLGSLPTAPQLVERRVKVQKGDTLAKVARRHGVSVSDLCDWNDLTPRSRVKRGSTLVIATLETPRLGRRPVQATLVASGEPPREAARGEIRAVPTPSSAIISVADLGVPRVVAAGVAGTSGAAGMSAADAAGIAASVAPRPLPSRYEIPAEGFVSEPPKARPSRVAARPRAETKKVVHTVRRGDTLRAIAARYGLTVASIKRQNRLRDTTLSIGQRLTLTLATVVR